MFEEEMNSSVNGSNAESREDMKYVETAEISRQLENYSTGYNSQNVKVLVDSKKHLIDSIKVLSDSTDKDSDEEVGRKLYGDTRDSILAVADIFTVIVENNYDLDQHKKKCMASRAQIEEQMLEAELLQEADLLEPRQHYFDTKVQSVLRHVKVRIDEKFASRLAVINLELAKLSPDQGEEFGDGRTTAVKERKATIERLVAERDSLKENQDAEIEAQRSALTAQYQDEYLAEYEVWKDKIQKKQVATAQSKRFKTELERVNVLEMVIDVFISAQRSICMKIREAVKKHPNIQARLKGTVILATTKLSISNPHSAVHLPGILQILSDVYHKNTFVNFSLSLMETMGYRLSESDTRNNPGKGVADVQKMKNVWDKKNMWDLMRSPDYFWTSVLLLGLHQNVSVYRREVISASTKFIRELEEAHAKGNSSALLEAHSLSAQDATPVFSFACKFIETEEADRKLISKVEGQKSTSSNNNNNAAGSGNAAQSNKNNSFANAAKRQQQTTSNNSSGRRDSEDARVGEIVTDPKFSGEVLASENVSVKDNKTGKVFPYVAVKKLVTLCSTCFGEDGNVTASPCEKGICYRSRCNKCRFAGHKGANCRQTHDVDGQALKA